MKLKNFLLFSAAILVLAACTKELAYKEAGDKFEDKNRNLVDTEAEYLYTASTGSITRTSSSAIPFALDENRRVKLKWEKDGLYVRETERDSRYAGNDVNNKPVLVIPVDYVDYQCAKDSYGECTNKEEQRTDINWSERAQFKVKPEAAKFVGLSFLPFLEEALFPEMFRCHTEIASRVVDFRLEKDAINISIERIFQVAGHCLEISPDSSITGAATVTAVFHYSMLKLDSALSKDFKSVSYPDLDSQKFGFFTTERSPLGSDNIAHESGKKVIMNHWNPNRTEINYYLSDEFAKPENKLVKKLTYQTVENLNEGLAEAGVQFRIKLNDPDAKNPGDNRNSMIVLVEDPVASGLLGYGPQVEDPVTGEIISARTVMFLGTMKSAISRTYEGIREEKKRLRDSKAQEQIQTDNTANEQLKDGGLVIENGLKQRSQLTRFNTKKLKMLNSLKKKTSKVATDSKLNNGQIISKAKVAQLVKDIKNYKLRKNLDFNSGSHLSDLKQSHLAHFRYVHEVKGCSLSEKTEGFTSGLSEKITALIDDNAKPWHQLTESEKDAMINKLLPVMWIPTLIHEMGHNLGLRHNFQASEDKENFYSETELKERGLEYQMPFNSVMEYAEDTLALTKLGKYDIAALRFGYNREVEVKDEKTKGFSTIKIEDSLGQMVKNKTLKDEDLKPYGYCTDEHAGINAGCRRFDLGISMTEIVKNAIQTYEDEYRLVNFRRDRESFSLFGDYSHAQRQYGRFVSLRLMQEVVDRLIPILPLESPEWEQEPFLKDLKDASTLAGQFLMKVVATPDLHCVIASSQAPEQIMAVRPIGTISDRETNCFNLKLQEPYIVLGQFGKLFNSKKDPNSENNYADQIDVRGYWIDKLMATRALFNRSLDSSILDKELRTFADRSDIQPILQELMLAHMLGQLGGPQVVELAEGGTAEIDLPVDTFESQVIDKPMIKELAEALGIPNSPTNFNQLLAETAVKQMPSGPFSISGRGFAESFKVNRLNLTSGGGTQTGMLELKLGTERLVAAPENILAYEALSERALVITLDQVDKAQLQAVLKARSVDPKAQAPADATAAVKYAYQIPVQYLTVYLSGGLKEPAFYENLVNILPN
ncbi:MAG: zinc-dependent metalloprotease [Pseudobdellovibrionaceae bacterium]